MTYHNPTAVWDILARSLSEQRPVRARYHGSERLLCPHLLGWKNGRATMLAYQAAGTTSTGLPPAARWRTMFLDEIEEPEITNQHWETAHNYSPPDSNGIDYIALSLGA